MIKDIIRMSFQNLKMNKIRTFLTTLGIIIGIASIIALITIGQGVTSSVIEQLSGLGGNRVTVSITDTKAIPGFTDSNLREFTALENVEGISPSLRSYKPVTLVPGETNSLYNYVYTSSASVMGVNNYYFSLFKAGRAINDDDVAFSTHVCVLGETVWKNLYGNYDPIGETIRIQNMDFVIVGILNNLVGLETRGNYSVIVPYTVAMTDLQMGLITTFDAIVSDTESMNITVSQMSDLCADIVGSTQGYSVTNQQEVEPAGSNGYRRNDNRPYTRYARGYRRDSAIGRRYRNNEYDARLGIGTHHGDRAEEGARRQTLRDTDAIPRRSRHHKHTRRNSGGGARYFHSVRSLFAHRVQIHFPDDYGIACGGLFGGGGTYFRNIAGAEGKQTQPDRRLARAIK